MNDPELKKVNDSQHKRIIENAKSFGITIKNTPPSPYPVYQQPFYQNYPVDQMNYQGMYAKQPGYYMQQGMTPGNMGHQGMGFQQYYLGDQGNNFANNKHEDRA